MDSKKIDELISQMTLEEMASMCSGKDSWYLKGVERLGIPSVMVSDGPHGLRTQRNETDHLGLNDSISAVCFPAACATAASFDTNLLNELGATLGEECLAEDVSVLLGPAMNIKRSPLCGRNFEYFSEDPCLNGMLAASYIDGVQSKGVGVSVKHFALNNQETRRMTVSAEVDERTLHEIYLSGFETAIKQSKPQTVMCAYNQYNGIPVSQNEKLLTDILRKRWGFEGYVMSDWGAVVDRVSALKAGLDLEMPYSGGETDAEIVSAVQNGTLSKEVLVQAVKRILNIIYMYAENKPEVKPVFAHEKHHLKAVAAQQECTVLLKNEHNVLPLNQSEHVAVIGEFAFKPRYQGGGSSHVNAFKAPGAAEFMTTNTTLCKGYDLTADEKQNKSLLDEAIKAAKAADKAVLFIGLPDTFESEGYDRTHMSLPIEHNRLVEEVCKVCGKVVVVLHNGSPVEMPWIDKVQGAVEVYLGGQGVGEATANILYGKANPCGRLPETFPIKLSDNPSHLNFPGDGSRVSYAEGLFVGYRYYDIKQMPVLFPFGHGLSYTTFDYKDLKLSKSVLKAGETLNVTVTVSNTGKMDGKEVVSVYVSSVNSNVQRPIKELKQFTKVFLKAGQSKEVTLQLNARAFSYYDVQLSDWRVPSGEVQILICKSANEIILSKTVNVVGQDAPLIVTQETTLNELSMHAATKPFVDNFVARAMEKMGGGVMLGSKVTPSAIMGLAGDMPLRGIRGLLKIDKAALAGLIAQLNGYIEAYNKQKS